MYFEDGAIDWGPIDSDAKRPNCGIDEDFLWSV
jgi:hypothetical protein